MVTARFLVGTNEDDAVLRVHDKIRANIDRIPIGIPEPLIVGRGINDVADRGADAVAEAGRRRALDRQGPVRPRGEAAHRAGQGRRCRHQLYRRQRPEQIRVEPDPEKLSLYRRDPAAAHRQGARRQPLVRRRRGARCRQRCARRRPGRPCSGVPDIGLLLLTTRDGRPVYVRDVAEVRDRRRARPRAASGT